jgi:hypothetical protein
VVILNEHNKDAMFLCPKLMAPMEGHASQCGLLFMHGKRGARFLHAMTSITADPYTILKQERC